MELDSKGRRLISIVRIIEYHGTDEWIESVMKASRLPWQGKITMSREGRPFPEGCEIKSGLVVWEIVSETGEEKEAITIPPPTTVQ